MSTIQVYRTPKLDSNNTHEFNKSGQNYPKFCAYDMIGLGWIMEDASFD